MSKDERQPHPSARPDAPRSTEAEGPLRPPRPPIGLPILPDGRTALPKGNPCVGCDHCCRYVALEIDRPRSKLDYDNIRWYLLHRNISVVVDWDGAWMIQFDTPCEWLVEGRCSHYRLRPDICREYDPADCERYNPTPAQKYLLRNERDLEQYLAARRKGRKKPKASARSRGPGRAGR